MFKLFCVGTMSTCKNELITGLASNLSNISRGFLMHLLATILHIYEQNCILFVFCLGNNLCLLRLDGQKFCGRNCMASDEGASVPKILRDFFQNVYYCVTEIF